MNVTALKKPKTAHIPEVLIHPELPHVTIALEYISPETATDWLNMNTENRHMRSDVAEKYARDMKAGAWTNCVAPIVWLVPGPDGKPRLGDGQHRLWAIIESGCGQWFTIWRGATKEDLLNIDRGLNRTMVDNMHFATGTTVTTNMLSCVRWIEWGQASPNKKKPSDAEVGELLEKHRDAAHFAVNHIRGKSFNRACVTAAVARAWYAEEDKERLLRFCRVLSSGQSEGEKESAAVTLRNYLVQQTMRGATSKDASREAFVRAQNAIAYFMRGKKLSVLKHTDVEAYPRKKGGKK